MMSGHWVAIGGTCALGLSEVFCRHASLRQYRLRADVLAVVVGLAGVYLIYAAYWYAHLAHRYGQEIAPTEPDFFAAQTLTTVGYGGGVAFLRDNTPAAAANAFRAGSTVAMLVGSALWGVFLTALANAVIPREPT
jgi:hypothetical protein